MTGHSPGNQEKLLGQQFSLSSLLNFNMTRQLFIDLVIFKDECLSELLGISHP